MKETIKEIFIDLCSKYSSNEKIFRGYWNEIEKSYSHRSRHYHNLIHLENMIMELSSVQNDIEDFDSVVFSIFYHDFIYKSTSKDNEEKNAEYAKSKLRKLNYNDVSIDKVYNQILATKSHQLSNQKDTNYLLDSDLSILGKSWNEYELYIKQIRKEYSIYPDFIYNSGRKKVLKHFLTFDRIYKTEYFKDKYEKQARENISKEIELL
ncbi:HD domain-containing protein [Empedobacter falsenii]|nr:hypothetical protein [Flavobacteriaceae bacterium]